MRFENTDCILFPGPAAGQPHGAGQPPSSEFRVNCFAVRDASLVAGAVVTAPLMHCFTPSMAAGEAFQVSIHDWEPTGFHFPSSTVHHVKVVVDGLVQHSEAFEMAVGWPKLIIGGNAAVGEDGMPELLRFPAFNQSVMSESRWNPYDEAGRIKVEVSEGYIDLLSQRYVKNTTHVIFNFQPAPMDVLQRANIAWPNPSMVHNPILAPSLQHPNPLASAQNNPPPPTAPFAAALQTEPQQHVGTGQMHQPPPQIFSGVTRASTAKARYGRGQPDLVMTNPRVDMFIPSNQVDKVLDRLNVRLDTGPGINATANGSAKANLNAGTGASSGINPGAMLPPPLPNRIRSRQERGVQTINENSQGTSTAFNHDSDADVSASNPSDRGGLFNQMSSGSEPQEDASSMNSAALALSAFASSPAAPPMPPSKLQSRQRTRAATNSSQPTERDTPPKRQKKAGNAKKDKKTPEEVTDRHIVVAGPDNA